MEIKADFVIVGSGAGGATVAKELSEQGKNVLILEKSEEPTLTKRIYRICDANIIYKIFGKLGVIDRNLLIWNRIGIGGTTTITSGNAVRSLEKELYSLGVNIEDELQELDQMLVRLFPQNLMGKGAKEIWDGANSLGFKFEPMPKFVDFKKCIGCNKCNDRCPTDAKWTALNFIERAKASGASLLKNVQVTEVITSQGNAVGVKALGSSGAISVRANVVVLAAGAIETAVILQRTGIVSAGRKFFCDPCYYVYGPKEDGSFDKESCAIINSEFLYKDGFTLINWIVQSEAGKGLPAVMIKIKDDPNGIVHSDGSIRKMLTYNDLRKLHKAVFMAKRILKKAGVDHRYIKTMTAGGFHPGGTAGIGDVVDQNQETEVKNLFVSDASVLPNSPGLPPMLTIMALSKRIAKRLVTMV